LVDSLKVSIRGIPVDAAEVVQKELEMGAMLFDESVFSTLQKQIACANVIVELDRRLRVYQETRRTRELPEYLDIGDKSWLYIPHWIFDPKGGDVITLQTEEKPMGLVAWFRVKRNFKAIKFN
jgi:hypothetical protein